MNVRNVFPSPWISCDDLGNRTYEVTISRVSLETVHDRVSNQKVEKMVVAFEGAKKRLICNKTQAFTMAGILESDNTDDWIGKKISLRAGKAHNGKPTIVIAPAAVVTPAPQLNS